MKSIRLLAVLALAGLSNMAVGAPITFSSCGAGGAIGPTQAACDAAYASTDLAGQVSVAGGIQAWTFEFSGLYSITAQGAQGAAADINFRGGLGARVSAQFEFLAGDTIFIAVGQAGTSPGTGSGSGGGGGGSFVVDASGSPLLIAGGGGGTRASVSRNGHDASITQFGTTGSGSSASGGGAQKTTGLGLGGIVSSLSWGSGGAGFFGNGASDGPGQLGGLSWANGLLGGANGCGSPSAGGFGGGGSGSGCWGGGGGGGYSGGDGGRVAGGGGSFLSGLNQTALAGVGFGNGFIEIELLSAVPVPAPATLLLFAVGLVAIGSLRRRRDGRD